MFSQVPFQSKIRFESDFGHPYNLSRFQPQLTTTLSPGKGCHVLCGVARQPGVNSVKPHRSPPSAEKFVMRAS